jgi:hypothetical protein
MMVFLFRNGNKRVITQIKPCFVKHCVFKGGSSTALPYGLTHYRDNKRARNGRPTAQNVCNAVDNFGQKP